MGFEIGKRFAFSASHELPGLPPEHKCGRVHGHNYEIMVVLEPKTGQLIAPGFVTDFGDLTPLKTYLDGTFDHRHLNDVLDEPPTSERLAAHIAGWVIEHLEPAIDGRLARVLVSETGSTWATYIPERAP